MEELIASLCSEIEYTGHEIGDGIIYIYARSNRSKAECPQCGCLSSSQQNHYTKRVRDLPIHGLKTEIVLDRVNYVCKNPECATKTFAESFSFFANSARRAHRLDSAVMKVALKTSSVAASDILKETTAGISKSTICTLIKKNPQ